jgi:hypothetical protein
LRVAGFDQNRHKVRAGLHLTRKGHFMSARSFGRLAAPILLLIGWTLPPDAALAGDRPATEAGVQTLEALLDRFLPTPPPGGPPFVTVKPEGQNYLVSADLSAFNGLLRAVGAAASYEPATLLYKLFEQDDGKWRVAQDSLPKIVAHADGQTSTVEIENFRQTLLIDPAIAWWLSGSGSADKGALAVHAPKVDQSFDFGPVHVDYATSAGGDGTVSTSIKEEIDDIAFKVSGADPAGRAVSASGRVDRAVFRVGADGLKTRKAFDLASLLSAHRDDLAQHEAELKGLLKELAAPGLKIVEGGEAAKVMFASPYGPVALAGLKLAVAVANAGPQSAIEARATAEGLSLPVALAPPEAAELAPSKIDVTATLKGIDVAAGASEAIADVRLGRPGPALADEDAAKVARAFLSAGPVQIQLSPSHVVAPAIDADVEGAFRWGPGKPSGAVTIRMRDFDKTMTAVKGLGPDIAAKSIPALAMAKGLAKTESDGALSWLVEFNEDRSIKVNGVPLGKAPE